MAAGESSGSDVIDTYLHDLFKADAGLRVAAPGGPFVGAPPDEAKRPCLRWWYHSEEMPVYRQDGQSSRLESAPLFYVCLLDQQDPKNLDYTYGTIGSQDRQPKTHLANGRQRLFELLHNQLRVHKTYEIYSQCERSYRGFEEVDGNKLDVFTGYFCRFRVT